MAFRVTCLSSPGKTPGVPPGCSRAGSHLLAQAGEGHTGGSGVGSADCFLPQHRVDSKVEKQGEPLRCEQRPLPAQPHWQECRAAWGHAPSPQNSTACMQVHRTRVGPVCRPHWHCVGPGLFPSTPQPPTGLSDFKFKTAWQSGRGSSLPLCCLQSTFPSGCPGSCPSSSVPSSPAKATQKQHGHGAGMEDMRAAFQGQSRRWAQAG